MGVALAAGCASYHEKPLDAAAVQAALEPPSLAEVRATAATLAHPLLRPLVIDGRDGFTPDEMALLAVIASPRLRALRDQRRVAAAQVFQAGLLPNPQLAASLDAEHGNHDPTLVNGTSVGLSWEATALLGYRDRVAGARATADALDLDIAWQEWQAAEAARLDAYRVLSLEAQLPAARATEAELADTRRRLKKAHADGYATTADLAAATEAWSAAQDARLGLEQELASRRVALALAVGRPAGEAVPLKSAPLPALPADAREAGRLLDGLAQRRFDLVALRLGYASADASLRAAVKAQFPKIGLSFGRARDTSDVRTWSFGVTIDLPLFDRNQAQVAAGEATRQQLFDDYVARMAEARADVVQTLSQLAAARAQLRSVEAALPELAENSAALDRAMQRRNADLPAWRDARSALRTRRAERAKLQMTLLELGVALELASGRPLLLPPGDKS